MKTFKQFMNEETMPFAGTDQGFVGIEDPAVRDNLNQLLAGVTNDKFITPYIGLERVAKALANYHIFIPKHSFLEGDSGMLTFPINQFGGKVGMQNDGQVVTSPSSPFSIFFEYRMGDCGMYRVFCEVVNQEELDEILADIEDEMNDEGEDEELDEATLVAAETGPRKTPGSHEGAFEPEDDEEDEETDDDEAGLVVAEEKDEPPFEPTEKKSTPYKSFKSKAKQLARDAMKKEKKKEKIDEVSKETAGRYVKKAADDAANAAHDMGQLRGSKDETEQEIFNREKAKYGRRMKGINMAVKKLTKEENLEEVSKKTLASYVKKASHDVATKSAATGRYADRANRVKDEIKKGDYSNYQQGKKDDAFADKMFKKSWNRRKGIAKAADKLAKD